MRFLDQVRYGTSVAGMNVWTTGNNFRGENWNANFPASIRHHAFHRDPMSDNCIIFDIWTVILLNPMVMRRYLLLKCNWYPVILPGCLCCKQYYSYQCDRLSYWIRGGFNCMQWVILRQLLLLAIFMLLRPKCQRADGTRRKFAPPHSVCL